ncbi:MAG: hypothetical protein JW873_03865 [Candidatus Saganbacteria bacterium]|nr:hypothetical protein [Candidatus Saganbacteria bacterium]
MNIQNNAKVIETAERSALFTYFEKLIEAKTVKLTLFPVFPYTAAANLSEPRSFFLIQNLDCLAALNGGRPRN